MSQMTGVGPAGKPAAQGPGGVRSFLTALLESAVLLLLMVGAEKFFFGDGYYAGLDVHPFWLVVLLAAMQHGVFVGVITVAAASALIDWPEGAASGELTPEFVETAILPLQWLIAALCIGFVRQMQIRAARKLLAENARLTHMNEVLQSQLKRLGTTSRQVDLEVVATPGEERVPPHIGRREAPRVNAGPPLSSDRQLRSLREAGPVNLARRFSDAATALMGRPCTILAPDETGEFHALSGTDRIPGLSLPLDPGSRILSLAMAADGAVVQPAGSGGREAKGVLAAIALPGSSPGECAALILALGHDSADATTLLPALETLASAADEAISNRGLPAVGTEGNGRSRPG